MHRYSFGKYSQSKALRCPAVIIVIVIVCCSLEVVVIASEESNAVKRMECNPCPPLDGCILSPSECYDYLYLHLPIFSPPPLSTCVLVFCLHGDELCRPLFKFVPILATASSTLSLMKIGATFQILSRWKYDSK